MNVRTTIARTSPLVIAALMLVAGAATGRADAGLHATATIVDQSGTAIGTATFFENPAGRVVVGVDVEGLSPGEHGMHLHTTGACIAGTSPAFASAGGHFNPTGGVHGAHAGDLGNLSVNPQGNARTQFETAQFTLSPGLSSLLDGDGSALVIHRDPDDGVSDPAGNSGPRVACGALVAG